MREGNRSRNQLSVGMGRSLGTSQGQGHGEFGNELQESVTSFPMAPA